MNIQFAIQNGIIYVLEVNPRASRTAPFVSKATGVPLAKIGARVMTGQEDEDDGERDGDRAAVFLASRKRCSHSPNSRKPIRSSDPR